MWQKILRLTNISDHKEYHNNGRIKISEGKPINKMKYEELQSTNN